MNFMVKSMKSAVASAAAAVLVAGLAATAFAQQGPGGPGAPGSAGTPPSGGVQTGEQNLGGVVGAQQQLSVPGPPTNPQSSTAASQDPSFRGSLVRDKATDGVLQLSLDDAIHRGLRNNLGLILQTSSEMSANGSRLQELQKLLPTVTGAASITIQQIDLAAYGLKFPGLNPIIGPFQVVDFRAYLTQNLVNLNALENYLAAKHNFEAAKLTAQDARDLVVLTVGNAYLLCIADAARITAVRANMDEAKASLDQADAAHQAGTSPRLDVLRAQVDYQNEQQQLIATTNTLAKDKLALARAIGLPLEQKFELSDTAPYAVLNTPDPDAAFQQALKQRKDLAAAAETLKGAEESKRAAFYEQMPTADVSGNYGDLGTTPGHSHGTFTATGEVTAPILQIAKTHGDEQVAAAQYDQAKAKLSDQVQQVNADVRDAILDIQTAAKLVDAAKSNVDLANEALSEAQQRFKAGVADSLPVSQALATDEQANDQYISALYQHNVAKLALARALGVAASDTKTYLGGK
jgi:outer membrane protein TolC